MFCYTLNNKENGGKDMKKIKKMISLLLALTMCLSVYSVVCLNASALSQYIEYQGSQYQIYKQNDIYLNVQFNGTITKKTEVTIPSSFTYDRYICNVDKIYNLYDMYGSVEVLNIPASVTVIEDMDKDSYENLKAINVAAGNPNYASEDGVLFNKAKTAIIFYPYAKTTDYTVPQSVTDISGAFSHTKGLKTIYLHSGMTSIGNSAFYSSDLEIVHIPSSVTSIENNAFQWSDLTDVYFYGSEEQWKSIEYSEEYNNSLASAIIHFDHTHSFTNYVYDNNATCTNDGTETAYCDSGCHTKNTVRAEGTATGHSENDGVITKEATCTENGVKTYSCTSCGMVTKTETVSEKGHSLDEGRITTNATCTEDGVKTYYCTVCSQVAKRETIAAEGHTSDNGVITRNATCTESGVKTYSCTKCSEILNTETISATGHKSDDGYVDKDANCTDTGLKVYSCTVCGVVIKTENIPAEGHISDNGVITKNATCTKDGVKTYNCTKCGGTVKTESIGAFGHSFTNYVSDNNATCREDGTISAVCDNGCGEKDTYTDNGTATGHNDANGDNECDACGAEIEQLNFIQKIVLKIKLFFLKLFRKI